MTRLLLKRQQRERGFTLIELLIVIVVIGILAGIAILAFNPFQQSAAEACDRANARIEAGADAAVEAADIMEIAGLDSVDDFLDPRGGTLDCAFVAGGGGGSGGTGTVTEVGTPTETGSQVASPSVTRTTGAGNTLVALVASRADGDSEVTVNPTMSGWTFIGTARHWGGTTDRRYIAVFAKEAVGGSETITFDAAGWPGVGGKSLVVRELARSSGSGAMTTATFSAFPNPTGGDFSMSVSAGSDNGFVLAGTVNRGGGRNAAFSGLGGDHNANVGNLTTSSAFSSGNSVTSTDVTFSGSADGGESGFIVWLR